MSDDGQRDVDEQVGERTTGFGAEPSNLDSMSRRLPRLSPRLNRNVFQSSSVPSGAPWRRCPATTLFCCALSKGNMTTETTDEVLRAPLVIGKWDWAVDRSPISVPQCKMTHQVKSQPSRNDL